MDFLCLNNIIIQLINMRDNKAEKEIPEEVIEAEREEVRDETHEYIDSEQEEDEEDEQEEKEVEE
ncbi:MAG: hypothetical protein H0X03_08800 [Nitrosopumilus sp.]|nr:hypothetical protein [Nitrosopumilus sp.]